MLFTPQPLHSTLLITATRVAMVLGLQTTLENEGFQLLRKQGRL